MHILRFKTYETSMEKKEVIEAPESISYQFENRKTDKCEEFLQNLADAGQHQLTKDEWGQVKTTIGWLLRDEGDVLMYPTLKWDVDRLVITGSLAERRKFGLTKSPRISCHRDGMSS